MTGKVQEYYDLTEISIEEGSGSVEVTGSGSVTTDTLSAAPADWEPWEGCLVSLQDIQVTAEADYGQFETSWGVNIDDLFYEYDGAVPGSYASITGALTYTYEAYQLEPRDAADLIE